MTMFRRFRRRDGRTYGPGCTCRMCREFPSWICGWKRRWMTSRRRAACAGQFTYYETLVPQGYTNNGQIFGDWMGREAKGGQAWVTYHLSGREWIQAAAAEGGERFYPGRDNHNDVGAQVVKRLRPEVELNAWVQVESWKAPLVKAGEQWDVTAAGQITWFLPKTDRSK